MTISEKKWIQKAVKKSHKGYCTPMSKSTCTPKRKALAKRFKKGGDLYSGKTKSESIMPSIAALEILAVADQPVFENVMEEIGLHVEGRIDDDPLKSQVQTESIAAIASELTEDRHTFIETNPNLHEYKKMAEDYGFIVSFQ